MEPSAPASVLSVRRASVPDASKTDLVLLTTIPVCLSCTLASRKAATIALAACALLPAAKRRQSSTYVRRDAGFASFCVLDMAVWRYRWSNPLARGHPAGMPYCGVTARPMAPAHLIRRAPAYWAVASPTRGASPWAMPSHRSLCRDTWS